jgi:ankyrin repeat protein
MNGNNLSDEHGFSLMHWCAWDGHLSLVEMLMRRGAKLNSLNNCNDTPLHCAVQNGHFNVTIYVRMRNILHMNSSKVFFNNFFFQ